MTTTNVFTSDGKCKRCGCFGMLRSNGLCPRCDHALYGK